MSEIGFHGQRIVTDFDGVDDYVSIPAAGYFDVKSAKVTFKHVIDVDVTCYILACNLTSGTERSFEVWYNDDKTLKLTLGTSAGTGGSTYSLDINDYVFGDEISIRFEFDGTTVTFEAVYAGVTKTLTPSRTTDLYIPTQPLRVGVWTTHSSFWANGALYDLEMGTLSTLRHRYDGPDWQDKVGTAHGTINGSPSTLIKPK